MAPARLLLFTGAPRSSALDWGLPGLLDSVSEPFSRFCSRDPRQDKAQMAPGFAAALLRPSWRSIPLERRHLTTGHSQDHNGWQKASPCASFFTPSAVGWFIDELSPPPRDLSQTGNSETAEQVLSQFYEESYARHNDILSSQLKTVSDTGLSLHSSDTSCDAARSFTYLAQSPSNAKHIPLSGILSDLKDIPNASYLNSIHPQTMTVNLIIGVISVQPPRVVKTRHGTDIQLIEVLAGDETKSGFGISFWVPMSQSVQGGLERALRGLRSQDVVLLQNVALGSFRGKVYGQSLRRDMTKLHLLYRTRIDRSDTGGCYNAADLELAKNLDSQIGKQIKKTARVRDWCLKFVGPEGGSGGTNTRALLVTKEILPPDTQ
jgi:hypothetical protein